jgi:hypothetical protein
MRHEGKHRTKAERNAQFAESQDLTDPIRESWAVVASFYSALHYVEEFFAKYGDPCINHTERNAQFKGDIRIRAAYAHYEYLYFISRTARYKCEPLPEKAYQKYAKPRLLAVKQQIDHAMNIAARAQESGAR